MVWTDNFPWPWNLRSELDRLQSHITDSDWQASCCFLPQSSSTAMTVRLSAVVDGELVSPATALTAIRWHSRAVRARHQRASGREQATITKHGMPPASSRSLTRCVRLSCGSATERHMLMSHEHCQLLEHHRHSKVELVSW